MKPMSLSTDRLTLRRAIDGDILNLYHNYTSDEECSRFLTRKPHTSHKQTFMFLKNWCDHSWEKDNDKFAWVVSLRDTNEAIGVFLVIPDEDYKVEIHYGIGRLYWRQGITSELCEKTVQWLMNQPKLKRIWAVSDLDNVGSSRVLENTGFQKEGILHNWLSLPAYNNEVRDCYIYARTW